MRTRSALAGAVVLLLAGAAWFALDDPPRERPAAAGATRSPTTPAAAAPLGPTTAPRALAEGEELEPGRSLHPAATPAPDAGPADAASLDSMADVLRADAVKAWLRTNAAAAERYVDRYCAETKRLTPLAQPSRTRDAATFMAGKSDWENGTIGLLHLPAALTERMANPPLNWRTFGPADYAGLDFTWMRELLAFDHWSLTADGPLKNVESMGWDSPLPNYVTLQSWVKLRLIKGRVENDLPRASLEVRHLADLCASSGTFLLGEMIRTAMYGIERRVWEDAGLSPPEPLPTSDEVQRLRHASFAGMYFLMPGVPRSVREKALACTPARCATLTEGLIATAALRDLAPNAAEDLEWLQAQGPCDAVAAARFARGPAQPLETLFESYAGETGVEHAMLALLSVDGGQ